MPLPPSFTDCSSLPSHCHRWRLRARFADFPGKTVYHCHILDHEDLGMMGTVEVTA
ncbi:multicopper oxidase domain-containing protein [Synechococcus sp. PCC 7336]|uniref:multicopper oxidase domain-containing protein n=1 Tax=Synechococcus sp. PCC 7336 TaxID=195250 RepID=UPI00034D2394|nr:multicopper oxidase domain-containing protein [Synechococcus sp. PCC 7336]